MSEQQLDDLDADNPDEMIAKTVVEQFRGRVPDGEWCKLELTFKLKGDDAYFGGFMVSGVGVTK